MTAVRRGRKPAATEAEVRAALAMAEAYSESLLTVGTFAGLVARMRGCPDTWAKAEVVKQYVPSASVKAQLELLAEKNEVHPVKGDHWAVKGLHGINPNVTYWLPPHRKTAAIVRAENGHIQGVVTKAEAHAFKALAKAHNEEFQQYLEDYARLYPVPDYREKW